MIFSQTVTVDGVSAEVDFVIDENAVATYLGRRAMNNATGRSSLTKYVHGHAGRTSLLIAEVRKWTKVTLPYPISEQSK